MKLTKYLFISICFLSLAACSKESVDTSLDPAIGSDIANVSYGSNAQQMFDLYLPPNRSATTTKVFIFIHGGAWMSGDKSDFTWSIPSLKNIYFPKYAIVNMNYVLGNVLTGQYALPNQIDDIQAVIDLITAKSSEWQIKPEFVLCGHSAGAHLSMYYAYTKNNPKVKAVVSLAGPTDFEDTFYTSNIYLNVLFNGLVNSSSIPPGMTVNKYASPVTWIRTESTPTIAFFGSTDSTVPIIDQKTSLDNKMSYYSVPYESYIWNGEHNAFANEPNWSDISTKTKAFLALYNP